MRRCRTLISAAMMAVPAAVAVTVGAALAAETDLRIQGFGWRLPEGCTPPRAILALDVGLVGAALASPSYEVRYRWRKRPGGQWFARTLAFTNRLSAAARTQRLHIILPVDSSGAVWDFEVVLDPRGRIAERDESNNRARFSGACGGRGT
ncbi:MAG TPA: hypothetical protein VM325_13795 [Alphaproteobacteria bacterium]|nr:hypothetical protein [Alphaproteobacteria bacterium]